VIDADASTLHVRCGSDIRDGLREAGFAGDFLEYSDPICQGPVPDGLADAPRAIPGRFLRLVQSDDGGGDAGRPVGGGAAVGGSGAALWFEHDSYDQLILARCLAHFADAPRPARLELICIDRHPSLRGSSASVSWTRLRWRGCGHGGCR
jgi:hypothetical protein